MIQRQAIAGLALSAAALIGLVLSAALSHWRRQGFFNRPFQYVNAMVDALVINACNFRPLHRRQLLSFMLKQNNTFLVSSLLFWRGPFAVVWRIPLAWVYSVYGVRVCRRFAHVCIEVLKNLPAITNPNARKKVQIKVIASGSITTPPPHKTPSVVLLGASPIVRPITLPMLDAGFAGSFLLEAPARLGMTGPKFAGSDNALGATRTLASPCYRRATGIFVRYVRSPTCDKQATEYPTREINKSWHFFTLKWITVIDAWQSAVNRFSGATLAKPFHFNLLRMCHG